jgi:LysM repeat protein
VRAEKGVHVVEPGENLGTIARRYGVEIADLIVNNGLNNPNIIRTGERLIIPGTSAERYGLPAVQGVLPAEDGYHVVKRGETIAQIARDHGMAAADLMRLNGVGNPNFIWVGQQLRLTARVLPTVPDEGVKPQLANIIYVVSEGETLASIAREHSTTLQELLAANGLPNGNAVYVGQRLRVPPPQPPVSEAGVAGETVSGRRWIEINLSNQTLTAWQGNVAVMHTSVSTGKASTPTVTGHFQIGLKYPSQTMMGADYYLPGVPWVMYFFSDYAIHGVNWHANFGMPMSHGCVNMRVDQAERLYNWAPPGTDVYVHY